jgi:hypothetical protein
MWIKMTKIKSIEELAENYAMSAVTAAIKYQRALRKKGWPKDYSVNKAVKQGLGMIFSSGVSAQEVAKDLEEIEVVARVFRERLLEVPS